jgi:hypothetical protein
MQRFAANSGGGPAAMIIPAKERIVTCLGVTFLDGSNR